MNPNKSPRTASKTFVDVFFSFWWNKVAFVKVAALHVSLSKNVDLDDKQVIFENRSKCNRFRNQKFGCRFGLKRSLTGIKLLGI